MLSEQCHSTIQLCLGDRIRAGKNNGRRCFDLVVVKLTEVLHVNLYFSSICHCHGVTQYNIMGSRLIDCGDYIGQLAYTGRLNNHPVRVILGNHLLKSLSEVAYQRAANAAGVHFRDINACVLQKSAVNTDFTKFVLDQHQFLAAVPLIDHFLNQCGFACAEKAGININFCH